MTEEEKKAVEKLKEYALCKVDDKGFVEISANGYKYTLLNLIQKQDTEINSLKETIQKQEKSREHLKKQLKGEIAVKDTEINKLNNVIDRMAKKLSQVPMYHFKSKSNIYSSDNIDLVAMSVDEIKDYFMDMERRGEYE